MQRVNKTGFRAFVSAEEAFVFPAAGAPPLFSGLTDPPLVPMFPSLPDPPLFPMFPSLPDPPLFPSLPDPPLLPAEMLQLID